jgi:hypothetical protein
MPEFCFVCGAPATGVDHVPPRSFFPKRKDLPPGVADVRRNLITVPACNDHNGRYSKDDEVASYVILLTHKANQLGVDQFLHKGLRAITGRKGLVDSIFKKIEVYQLPDGREIPTFEFDAERVDKVMERIARGLFFDRGRAWRPGRPKPDTRGYALLSVKVLTAGVRQSRAVESAYRPRRGARSQQRNGQAAG